MFSDLTAASVAGGGGVVLKLSGTPQPLARAARAGGEPGTGRDLDSGMWGLKHHH